MKVFISVPMRGYTDEEIEKNINRMIEIGRVALKDKGELEFVDNFNTTQKDGERSKHLSVWYLSKAIEKISNCDAILAPINSYEFRGCECEAYIAREYNIPVYTISDEYLYFHRIPKFVDPPGNAEVSSCCTEIPEDDE